MEANFPLPSLLPRLFQCPVFELRKVGPDNLVKPVEGYHDNPFQENVIHPKWQINHAPILCENIFKAEPTEAFIFIIFMP